MVSTTGEQFAYYELDAALRPIEMEMPDRLRPSIARIEENCEPALTSVTFMGALVVVAGRGYGKSGAVNPRCKTGAGSGELRGAPVYIWPGGGITIMVDVMQMPENAFGYVPTPALVAPIEFTVRQSDYEALGGHMDHVMSIEEALAGKVGRQNDHRLQSMTAIQQRADIPWPGRG